MYDYADLLKRNIIFPKVSYVPSKISNLNIQDLPSVQTFTMWLLQWFPIIFSAGVGRTGTFIAIDSLLEQAKQEDEVDVYGYTCVMRSNRVNMIQTLVSGQ